MFEEGVFDIFHEFADGSTVWISSLRVLADAETHMKIMAGQKPGKYFVWSEGKQIAKVDTTLCKSESLH